MEAETVETEIKAAPQVEEKAMGSFECFLKWAIGGGGVCKEGSDACGSQQSESNLCSNSGLQKRRLRIQAFSFKL